MSTEPYEGFSNVAGAPASMPTADGAGQLPGWHVEGVIYARTREIAEALVNSTYTAALLGRARVTGPVKGEADEQLSRS